MTTPAGWYDDGSGRQRWWDGQQWTEHFAPEAAAPVESEAAAAESIPTPDESPAYDAPAAEEPSIDDTVIRPSAGTVITPEAQDWSAPSATESEPTESNAFAPQSNTAATTPLDDGVAAYSAPAAPVYPAAALDQPATGYPGSAPVAYPGAYSAAPGYPAAAPYTQPVPEEPKKVSILGIVGLGLAALGTILAFIPVVGIFCFIVLAAGFIVSLISLFLKGKKWPGITGLILAVVGTVIGIVMSIIYFATFVYGVSNEIDSLPSSSPSIEATEPGETDPGETDGGTTGAGRPTAEEVAVGITEILEAVESEALTPEQITCVAGEFVASEIPDDTLRVIANGAEESFVDVDAMTAFTDQFADALPVCLVP